VNHDCYARKTQAETIRDELENTASDYEADPDFYNLFGNTFLEYSASQQE
jgi:hypothetical protein